MTRSALSALSAIGEMGGRAALRPTPTGLAAVALMAAGLSTAGCSAAKPDAVETVWLRGDGSVASQADVAAARDRCAANVESAVTVSSNRRDSVQWGVRMVECMEGADLHLVQRERRPD